MNKIKKIIRKIQEGFLSEMLREIKWIFSASKKYKTGIIIYTLLTICTACITLVISVQLKEGVDYLLTDSWSGVMHAASIYMAIGLLNVGLVMYNQRLAAKISNNVRRELTTKAYEKVLSADWEKLSNIHSGDLITRLSEDATLVATSVVGWIPNILSYSIQICASALMIVYYDFSMVFIILIIAPIILLGSRIFLARMYKSNQVQRKVVSDVMTFFKESYQNIQTIKAFGLSDVFQGKSKKLQDTRYEIEMEVNKNSICSWGVMYVSGQLGALVCLAWAIYHIYTGVITIGTMTLLIVLASYISTAFKALVQLIPTAVTTIASTERIRQLMLVEDEMIRDKEKADEFLKQGMQEGIRVNIQDLNFSYQNGKEVFSKVSLQADPGEIVALVGPSGEGKTTMLRVLLGLVQVEDGSAVMSIGGKEEQSYSINPALRKAISYVPQGNTMMSGTIEDNMKMVRPEATEEEIVDALERACAMEFVKKLPDGIYSTIGESGIGFSEGQNQRLAIARALLCRTPVLFLDEATSALDVGTERRVLSNLMGATSNIRTCILTTHRPSVLSMCSRVYRIADTKITELNHDEIQKALNDF